MTLVVGQLSLPAAAVVRIQARAFAAEAAVALARLDVPEDAEALHDARVALRRLRSWLRAFEREVGLPGAVARRLRRLARSTGTARDLEVAVERLEELARRSRGVRRAALHRLASELAAQRDRGRLALRQDVARRWRGVQRSLERTLTTRHPTIAPRFATAVASRLAVAATPFGRRPPPALDWPALHALRIAGKRARYLLEPLRESVPGAQQALKGLKDLQEHLGAVNDAVVLEALLIEHAASAAREAAGAPRRTAAAARTLRDVGLAVAAVRAWRARLARVHPQAVSRRIGRLRDALARVVARLRSQRPVTVRGGGPA